METTMENATLVDLCGDDLLETLCEAHDIAVPRRASPGLLHAKLGGDSDVTAESILAHAPVAWVRQLCALRGVQTTGRRSTLVARLLAARLGDIDEDADADEVADVHPFPAAALGLADGVWRIRGSEVDDPHDHLEFVLPIRDGCLDSRRDCLAVAIVNGDDEGHYLCRLEWNAQDGELHALIDPVGRDLTWIFDVGKRPLAPGAIVRMSDPDDPGGSVFDYALAAPPERIAT